MRFFKKATETAVKETVNAVKDEAKKTVDEIKEKVGQDAWPIAAVLLGGLLIVTIVKRPSVTVKVVVKHG